VKVSGTDFADLRRADVSVAFADSPDRPVVTVASFLVRQPEPRVPPIIGGWEAITPEAQAGAAAQNPPPGQNPPPIQNPPPVQSPPTQPVNK
jgi:hypothetical protein